VFVRNNRATFTQLQAGTFLAESFEETWADFNRIAPAAKLDGDGSHVPRIGISGRVSKFDHEFYRLKKFLKKLAKNLFSEQKETEEVAVVAVVNNLSTLE
jgi:hypothetical protein